MQADRIVFLDDHSDECREKIDNVAALAGVRFGDHFGKHDGGVDFWIEGGREHQRTVVGSLSHQVGRSLLQRPKKRGENRRRQWRRKAGAAEVAGRMRLSGARDRPMSPPSGSVDPAVLFRPRDIPGKLAVSTGT